MSRARGNLAVVQQHPAEGGVGLAETVEQLVPVVQQVVEGQHPLLQEVPHSSLALLHFLAIGGGQGAHILYLHRVGQGLAGCSEAEVFEFFSQLRTKSIYQK